MRSIPLRDFFRREYGIEVGFHSYGCFNRWRMPGPSRIGRYCSFANSVRVVDALHPMGALTTHPVAYEKRFGVIEQDLIVSEPLLIEDDVWVGHNAIILPGCKFIGRGAIIGAGAIVTHDVPAYQVVAGVPARRLRERFPPALIERIERTRWWEREPEELAELEKVYPGFVSQPTLATLDAYLAAHA